MKKKIFLGLGIIVAIVIIAIAYLVVEDLKQEDLLKQEIINLSNQDLLEDNFEIEVKTTGDYGYIEEAIKKFYKELSDNVKILNYYLTDEELINILSADNLDNDRPNFQKSYQILEEAKQQSTSAIDAIANLCEEETIKKLIDQEKVDNYYYELYQKLMYTEEDLKTFKETKQEMEILSANLNLFLDKVKEILNMLEKNSNSWYIEDDQIYFDSDILVEEYNSLYDELTKLSQIYPSKTTNNSQSDI